jgi:hypothetical protein
MKIGPVIYLIVIQQMLFNSFIRYNSCFIDIKMINNTKYYHTFYKHYSTSLETEAPIYNQILQQEQIELHKSSQLIQRHGGSSS